MKAESPAARSGVNSEIKSGIRDNDEDRRRRERVSAQLVASSPAGSDRVCLL